MREGAGEQARVGGGEGVMVGDGEGVMVGDGEGVRVVGAMVENGESVISSVLLEGRNWVVKVQALVSRSIPGRTEILCKHLPSSVLLDQYGTVRGRHHC